MAFNYTEIRKYISQARLQNYERVCIGDTRKALKLYQTNLRVSQAFYPLLSLFEVILRNAINEEFITHFADPNWLINQQTGFMSHPSLTYRDSRTGLSRHNHFLKNSVAKSIHDLGAAVSHGKIIADLKFGFWTALYDRTIYAVLAGCPIRIFTNLPASANRTMVHQKLIRVRDFRNRMYHNEPVVFSKDAAGNPIFRLDQAKQIHNDIMEFFLWLDLDYKNWTKRINNINFEILRAECVMAHYPTWKYFFKRIILGFGHYLNKYL